MGRTLASDQADRHPVLPDVRPSAMAKADVREPGVDWLVLIGAAIQQAVKDAGYSHKEAAALAQVDAAEFGKWLSGTRRPQFDKLFAIVALRHPLVIAIARLAGDLDIVTEIRIRKGA